jgi:subtilisin-like proprotein convertase family protein
MPWLRCVKVQKKLEMKILRTIRKKMESPSRIRGLFLHRETERRIKDLGYTIFG